VVDLLPFADGGPGTAEAISDALGGRRVHVHTGGPLGAPLDATYVFIERVPLRDALEGPLAVIDSASACGLTLVPEERRDPLRASSAGVGALVRDALARGARSIVLGVGGTATNDGGAGVAQALGVRLLDAAGGSLPPGAVHLARLARVVRDGWPPSGLRIAVDVRNPLLGPEGATGIYGAQKGVRDWQAPALEAALARWAGRLHQDLDLDIASIPGAGAGGGLPCGLLAAMPDARVEPGAALVGSVVGLRARVEAADLVVTGEGTLDAQTAYGKAVAHIAAVAHDVGRPCLAVAGRIEARPGTIADAEAAMPDRAAREATQHDPAPPVEAAAERLIARWLGDGGR